MSSAAVDTLIVGQGLAGSVLAWELLGRGCRVLVVDNGAENASQVAAGLINPVAGRWLSMHALTGVCWQAAMLVYRQMAAAFAERFFVEMPMLRILQSDAQQAAAERRLAQAGYQPYLSGMEMPPPGIVAPFGVLRQSGTGYLRTVALLARLQGFFHARQAYRRADIDYRDISLEGGLRWQDVRTARIVFCEGHLATRNPWFGGLPFRPVKGEILTCEADVELPAHILNYGNWLVPQSDHRFRTGAGYVADNPVTGPTPAAREQLLAALAGVWPVPGKLEVVNHQAGIRPATADRQPLCGGHPRHAGLYLFNGFGSKGSLTIPWHAARFADYLLQGAALPGHADVGRYHAAYFPG